jgi:hypothetical protein
VGLDHPGYGLGAATVGGAGAVAGKLAAQRKHSAGSGDVVEDSLLLRPWRLFLAASTWKRLLYLLLKIPLGGISFAIFTALIPAIALFGMPLAYLAGFII